MAGRRTRHDFDVTSGAAIVDMQKDSDRGCAMIGSAFLDELLGELLVQAMIAGAFRAEHTEFGRRIDLAEGFALISTTEAKDLRLVNDIRRLFAHQLHRDGFERVEIVSACANLKTIAPEYARKKKRERFEACVMLLMVNLQRRAKDLKQPKPPADYPASS